MLSLVSGSAAVRTGVRLGVDVGSVRVGVARSDPDGVLASPLEVIPQGRGDMDRLAGIVARHDVLEVIVGLPTTLAG
jgi:putative Holliday junction resolvase